MLLKREKEKKKINLVVKVSNWGYVFIFFSLYRSQLFF